MKRYISLSSMLFTSFFITTLLPTPAWSLAPQTYSPEQLFVQATLEAQAEIMLFDVDGTLTNGALLNEDMLNRLIQFLEKGVIITLTSGRSWTATDEEQQKGRADLYRISQQFLNKLKNQTNLLEHIHFGPSNGFSFWSFDASQNNWIEEEVFSNLLHKTKTGPFTNQYLINIRDQLAEKLFPPDPTQRIPSPQEAVRVSIKSHGCTTSLKMHTKQFENPKDNQANLKLSVTILEKIIKNNPHYSTVFPNGLDIVYSYNPPQNNKPGEIILHPSIVALNDERLDKRRIVKIMREKYGQDKTTLAFGDSVISVQPDDSTQMFLGNDTGMMQEKNVIAFHVGADHHIGQTPTPPPHTHF